MALCSFSLVWEAVFSAVCAPFRTALSWIFVAADEMLSCGLDTRTLIVSVDQGETENGLGDCEIGIVSSDPTPLLATSYMLV